MDDGRIGAAILALLAQRQAQASICPSEVARSLAGDAGLWRELMAPVRQVANRLAADGQVVITQADRVLPLGAPIKGPVRLRRGPRFPNDEHST